MKRILSIIMSIVSIAFSLILLTNCVNDDITPSLLGDKSALKLNILTNTDVETRAGGVEAQECDIHHGFVYVFDGSGGYHTHSELDISAIINNRTATPILYFDAIGNIPARNTVVLILNYQTNNVTNPRDVTLSNIDQYFPLGGSTSEGFVTLADGIPMYGETSDWTTSSSSMTIRRAAAKFHVQLNNSVLIADHLMAQGMTSTDFIPSNLTYGLFNHATSGNIKYAEIVSGSTDNKAPVSEINDPDINLNAVLEGELNENAYYIYEYPYSDHIIAPYGDQTSVDFDQFDKNRLAVILKVNTLGSKPTPRYYRLDLMEKDEESHIKKYLDIKRNHHYRLVIREVNDAGYESATAAINGLPSNVVFEIVSTDGNTTIGDGTYAISVGKEHYGGKILEHGAQGATYLIADEVRYVLAKGINSLSDIHGNLVPSMTISSEPTTNADGMVLEGQLGPTSNPLSLYLPANYKGKVNVTLSLGELEYIISIVIIPGIPLINMPTQYLDCHFGPEYVTVNDGITWNTADYDYSYFNVSGNMISVAKENVQPVAWKLRNANGSFSMVGDGSNPNAIPIFKEKVLISIDRQHMVVMHAPEYVGYFGSPISNAASGQPHRRRAILEAVEEVDVVWRTNSSTFFTPDEYDDGLSMTKNLGGSDQLPALNSCYKKKNNESGVNWYLPAKNQIVGAYTSHTTFKHKFLPGGYWSSTATGGTADIIELEQIPVPTKPILDWGYLYLLDIKWTKTSVKTRCFRDL